MALGTPASVATQTGTTGAITTGSFTITSGHSIYVCDLLRLGGSVNPSSATITDSQSLTWAAILDVINVASAVRVRMQVWRATSNGNSMTVTVTPGATPPAAIGMQVVSISGASTDVSNFGSDVTNTAGDPAPSLGSAPDASSTVIGFAGMSGSTALSAPTNYTELNELFIAGSATPFETVYDAASAAQSATWSSINTAAVGILIEVKLGSQALTPSLFTNTQTFFAPTATPGAAALTPSLFTNAQTFYAPAVTVGAVTLTPPLFTNSQTFYDPAVTQSYPLAPDLFTNSQTFYAATVTPGSVDLAPSLFTNTQTFPAPTVTTGEVTLTPGLFTNSQIFYAPTVRDVQPLTPDLFTNEQIFYEPTVTQAYASNAPDKRTLVLPHMGSRVLNVPRPWQGQRSL